MYEMIIDRDIEDLTVDHIPVIIENRHRRATFHTTPEVPLLPNASAGSFREVGRSGHGWNTITGKIPFNHFDDICDHERIRCSVQSR